MRNILILLLICCFSFNANAQPLNINDNAYLIFGAGIVDWNLQDNANSTAKILALGANDDDNNAPAFKAGLGLDLNENFAIEAYFQYLAEGKMSFGETSGASTLDAKVDGYLYHLDLVGKLPINQIHEGLSIIGRAGYARSQASVKLHTGGLTADGYSNSNELTYGAGFELSNFRLEYQQINNIVDDPRIYTLGYIFRFSQLKE